MKEGDIASKKQRRDQVLPRNRERERGSGRLYWTQGKNQGELREKMRLNHETYREKEREGEVKKEEKNEYVHSQGEEQLDKKKARKREKAIGYRL